MTNYQLGVAGGKIIEDASVMANFNQLIIRHSMTGVLTFSSTVLHFDIRFSIGH